MSGTDGTSSTASTLRPSWSALRKLDPMPKAMTHIDFACGRIINGR